MARTAPDMHPPRALIVTLFGLYARESDDWLGIATLVRLMARLGVDEASVRSSVSRLKRRGTIHAERRAGAAGYTLDARTHHLLDLGDRRIFTPRRADLQDGWVLAVFSVPEAEREQRHVLRTRLTRLGFGTVSAGVWIAPRHVEDEARDVLATGGLERYVDLFHASYAGFGAVREQVATWWDLDELDTRYAEFDATHAPLLAAWAAPRPVVHLPSGGDGTEPEAFVDYVRTVTSWRRLPYLDPGLPPEVLPDDWSGGHATETFASLRRLLDSPARRFVDSVRSL